MQQPNRIALWIKLLYTAFVAVMVPCYWQHWGPQNFLYFCDVALLITLVGIWRGSALLVSIEAIAILIPQTVWLIAFAVHLLGWSLLGMTDYMFDPKLSLFLRALSLFHGWLPFLLLWLMDRLGYDRRAVRLQSIVGIVQLLICYFAFAPPGTHGTGRIAVNLNYAFGFSNVAAQTTMPPLLWLVMLLVGLPLLIYGPTHLVLRKCFRASDTKAAVDA